MENIVNINIEGNYSQLIEEAVNAVLENEKFPLPCQVDVSIVSSEEIQALNLESRGKDSVTDVLSFPMHDFENGQAMYDLKAEIEPDTKRLFLGDVVLCMDRAKEQAKEYGHSLKREYGFLVVHSVHHLLGYDHEGSEEDTKLMRKKEEEVLTSINLTR